jgi:hypothetical protein
MSFPNYRGLVVSLKTYSLALLATFLLIEPRAATAAAFSFDLTSVLGSDFIAEEIIDLNQEFTSVTSATLELSGTFTPGSATPVTTSGNPGPTISTDTVNLIIRLGDVGTAWIEKDVYAIQPLEGYQGNVAFSLPLQGVTDLSASLPVLLPSGDHPPDFSFLIDGRFEISTSNMHWLATIYQTLESPEFILHSFILHIEGTAVPEPSSAVIAILSSWIFFRRPKRGF